MGQRFAVAGYQNTGKSFPRRWIPDGHRVAILQPSLKFPYLYTGPANAHTMTPTELDAAELAGTRVGIGDFDFEHPEGTFKTLLEGYNQLANNPKTVGTLTHIPDDGIPIGYKTMDMLKKFNKHKATGFFKPEHIKGNVFTCPTFDSLKVSLEFVDKHMPWIHTVILPDFTHFITTVITSNLFLGQTSKDQAFQRYLKLAADGFKNFIQSSDSLRKDLVVVTEYHIEFNDALQQYELFVPGGKMVKEKFLPSSYYDIFLFTDVAYASLDDEAEPIYRYVTRKTQRYPEARCMGIYKELYAPNNLQEALTAFRAHYRIPVQY